MKNVSRLVVSDQTSARRTAAEPARMLRLAKWLPLIVLLAGAFPASGLTAEPAEHKEASLSVTVVDEKGHPTPVRVRLTDAEGEPVSPPQQAAAVLYSRYKLDETDGYAAQLDGSFYVDNQFEMDLPPGKYRLELAKGNEYLEQLHELDITPGARLAPRYRLNRWVDMASRGWYSVDGHIHLQRSERENPLIQTWIAAEDIHVGAMLQVDDFWAVYYHQYAHGAEGVHQHAGRMLTSGQEAPRTPEIGHTISLGADAFVRNPRQYYRYDHAFDEVHRHDGVTGYAHQGVTFHGYRGMALDVLRKKVDFLEVMQFCAAGGPLLIEHYYHFLDLGFQLTATGGSDFPFCGKSSRFGAEGPRIPRIGNARFYVHLGEEAMSFEAFRRALRMGHTFASSGPIVQLTVNGKLPGETLDVSAGSRVTVRAEALGHSDQVPLANLEIVGHSGVLRRVGVEQAGQSTDRLVLELELPVEKGIWIAARCSAGPLQMAHTTPVYVRVDGGTFANLATLHENLDKCERYLQELEQEIATAPAAQDPLDRQAWRHREDLEARVAETREVIENLRSQP